MVRIMRMRSQSVPVGMEGDIGVYGIAVLGLFSGGISVIQVPSYGIAVCGFSSF